MNQYTQAAQQEQEDYTRWFSSDLVSQSVQITCKIHFLDGAVRFTIRSGLSQIEVHDTNHDGSVNITVSRTFLKSYEDIAAFNQAMVAANILFARLQAWKQYNKTEGTS